MTTKITNNDDIADADNNVGGDGDAGGDDSDEDDDGRGVDDDDDNLFNHENKSTHNKLLTVTVATSYTQGSSRPGPGPY